MSESVGALVIGGGIFGCAAALILAHEQSVALVEKEARIFMGASSMNQARVHTGLHYLRAPHTAKSARRNFQRFVDEHSEAINSNFEHIYGLDRFASLTSASGFRRMCRYLGLGVEEVTNELLSDFDSTRFQALFRVYEPSYDSLHLRRIYESRLAASEVDLRLNSWVESADNDGVKWTLRLRNSSGQETTIKTPKVLNATYASLNEVNALFGLGKLSLREEATSLLLVKDALPESLGLTIMDGAFLSVTPYGFSGLHCLSSVPYSHLRSHRSPRLNESNPVSTARDKEAFVGSRALWEHRDAWMLKQLRGYLRSESSGEGGEPVIHRRIQAMKVTWAGNDYRDERQTVITRLSSSPDFFALLSGKVSSIYELEESLRA